MRAHGDTSGRVSVLTDTCPGSHKERLTSNDGMRTRQYPVCDVTLLYTTMPGGKRRCTVTALFTSLIFRRYAAVMGTVPALTGCLNLFRACDNLTQLQLLTTGTRVHTNCDPTTVTVHG